jgi:hypothetical protein
MTPNANTPGPIRAAPGPCTPLSPCVLCCTNTCQDDVEADILTQHPLSLLSAVQHGCECPPRGQARTAAFPPKLCRVSQNSEPRTRQRIPRWPATEANVCRRNTRHSSPLQLPLPFVVVGLYNRHVLLLHSCVSHVHECTFECSPASLPPRVNPPLPANSSISPSASLPAHPLVRCVLQISRE